MFMFWMQGDKVGRPIPICEVDAVISDRPSALSATYCPYVRLWPSLSPCITAERPWFRVMHGPTRLFNLDAPDDRNLIQKMLDPHPKGS